jgi:hypothetical protein
MTEPKIKAELILASKNAETGDILYTFRLTYPRMILAEFLTHRVFSRNTSSSRAIPGKRMRRAVKDSPFIPKHIGAAQSGMRAGAELTGWRRKGVELIWSLLRWPNILGAWGMEKLGAHKQIANRVLEPWMWVTQVASATDIENFLKLRAHEMAEPHFQELARSVKGAVETAKGILGHLEDRGNFLSFSGKYQILLPGEWHLPFITQDDRKFVTASEVDSGMKRISAARCARTSYTLIEDGKQPSPEKDYAIGQALVGYDPIHASPLEHQAQAMSTSDRWANFRGFKQFRFDIPNENGGDKK